MGDHLFRRLLLLLLLFTFLVPSLAAASNPAGEPDNLLADADGPIDWVVVEYVFDRQYDRGGQVDTVKFEYGIEGTFIEDSSEEPRYFGFDLAWSGTHVFRGLSVLPLAPGPLHTTVVTPLGGHDVLLSSPAEQSRDARVSGWVEDGVGFRTGSCWCSWAPAPT